MSDSRRISSMLMESQIRWYGHIALMPDYRLRKPVFVLKKSGLETGLVVGQESGIKITLIRGS